MISLKMIKTVQGDTLGGETCLWNSEIMDSKQRSNSGSYSLVIVIFPAASARRYAGTQYDVSVLG